LWFAYSINHTAFRAGVFKLGSPPPWGR